MEKAKVSFEQFRKAVLSCQDKSFDKMNKSLFTTRRRIELRYSDMCRINACLSILGSIVNCLNFEWAFKGERALKEEQFFGFVKEIIAIYHESLNK